MDAHRTEANDDWTYNNWWIEGSAEWFGVLVHPGFDRTNLAVDFEMMTPDIAISEFELPGAEKHHEETLGRYTWPLFAWLSERFGAQKVLAYLDRLPRRLHEPADVARWLRHEEWESFATAYSAFTVWMTGIGPIDPADRAQHPVFAMTESDYSLPRPAGKLVRYAFQLTSGEWRFTGKTTGNVGQMYLAKRKSNGDPDGAWIPLDGSNTIRSVCEQPLPIMIVGFGSHPDSKGYSFGVERVSSTCEERCADIPTERNSCVVGKWREKGYTPGEAIEDTFSGLLEVRHPPAVYSFDTDGSFERNSPFLIEKELEGPPGIDYRQITHYTLNAERGFWGTRGDALAVCEQETVTRGSQITAFDGQQAGMPLNFNDHHGGVEAIISTFECDDNRLVIRPPNSQSPLVFERLPNSAVTP